MSALPPPVAHLVAALVDAGAIELSGVTESGDVTYKLTEQGEQSVRNAFAPLGLAPDEVDAVIRVMLLSLRWETPPA